MQNWDDLRYFLAVARTGSFLAASESLFVNSSTVGRRIDQLEDRLTCSLFDRQRYGMTLTPDGRRLLAYAEKMESASLELENAIKGADDALNGSVQISVSDGLGSFWLTPNLAHFQKQYPQIALEIISQNQFVDLAKREADIAIRLKEPMEPFLKRRLVGTIKFHVFASPRYIDQYGMVKDWTALSGHKVIDYTGYHESKALRLWQETVKNHDKIVFKTNSAMSFITALRSGMGIGLLPRFYQHTVSDLIMLDLPCDVFSMPIYVISHEDYGQTARIKAVKTYIESLFERDKKVWFS